MKRSIRGRIIFGAASLLIIGVLVVPLFRQQSFPERLALFGSNIKGQLGTTQSELHASDVAVPEYKDISIGFAHALLLDREGVAWAWGDNNYGQLALGSAKGSVASVEKIKGLPKLIEVAAGFRHSLFLDDQGAVWASGNNIAGQLGDGSRNSTVRAVRVSLPGKATHVTAGHRFSFATLSDGRVFAWGASCENAPHKTFTDLLQLVGQSASGISYYVDADADPADSDNKELCEFQGFTPVNSLIPVEIESLKGSVALSAGFGHVLALQVDGSVTSMGCNAYGQLGREQLEITPAAPVNGLPKAVAIAATTRHSLVLDEKGTVWGFGSNHDAQLGNNDIVSSIIPLLISGLPKITKIAAGHDTSFALDEDGKLWAWGNNEFRQLPGAASDRGFATVTATDERAKQLWAGGSTLVLAREAINEGR